MMMDNQNVNKIFFFFDVSLVDVFTGGENDGIRVEKNQQWEMHQPAFHNSDCTPQKQNFFESQTKSVNSLLSLRFDKTKITSSSSNNNGKHIHTIAHSLFLSRTEENVTKRWKDGVFLLVVWCGFGENVRAIWFFPDFFYLSILFMFRFDLIFY